jgi:hypothetical protein
MPGESDLTRPQCDCADGSWLVCSGRFLAELFVLGPNGRLRETLKQSRNLSRFVEQVFETPGQNLCLKSSQQIESLDCSRISRKPTST